MPKDFPETELHEDYSQDHQLEVDQALAIPTRWEMIDDLGREWATISIARA
jgi:hypothetical protein